MVMKAYKTFHKTFGYEMRVYEPVKRTIFSGGKSYFLPFPYVVFYRKLIPINYMRPWNPGWLIFARMANKEVTSKDQLLYDNILGGGNYPICLNYLHHFVGPFWTSFNTMITRYWSTSFSPNYLSSVGGSFSAWEELSIEEVLKAVSRKRRFCGEPLPN